MADIEFSVRGGIAHVLLNRPAALNALTWEMCVEYDAKLKAWATDPAVRAVVIRGAGEKAFCAGGDVRKVCEEGLKKSDYPRQFFSAEYRVNRRIKTFPKPYIALIDGIVMGGGVGLSVHGSHRIASEGTMFAMPETGIGLFPDVGGSYFLPRCPGRTGWYLALTGARMKAADCVHTGIATAYVPRAALDSLVAALEAGEAPDAAIARHAADPGAAPIAALRAEIDRVFDVARVEDVNHPGIAGKSPTSLKLTFEQLRRGAGLSFDECMRQELRMVMRVMDGVDFYEGIRALLIDKDQKPVWRPASLAEVTDADIAAYFAPMPGNELTFD
jgi:enoyl-CoA hydratase